MMEYKTSAQDEFGNKEGFSVRVLGIGGAGANALDRIALEGTDSAELVSMNTDIRALTTSVSKTKIQLGKDLTKGLGAGGDPELGRDAAVEAQAKIREAVNDHSIVFICVGLGGGTGSGAAPVVARLAKQSGAFVVVFATFPFSFEGRRRLEQAQESLNELVQCSNAVMVFENDRMGELIVAKEGIQKAFAAADKVISQSVRAVTQIVTKAGMIHIGLDDLISALRNTDSRCLFGYGRASGENRAQAAVRDALKSPLLDRGQLSKAGNVLVHICGGESLTLFEVELLMDELGKALHDDAQIFFGTGTDQGMGEDVGVTIISSLGNMTMEGAKSASVPAARPAVESDSRREEQPAREEVEAQEESPVEEPQEAEVTAEADNNGSRRENEEDEGFIAEPDGDDAVSAEEVPEEAPVEERVPVAMAAGSGGSGGSGARGKQAELKLNPGARGRFEKSEPTIIDGEDLDVPTFLRDKD